MRIPYIPTAEALTNVSTPSATAARASFSVGSQATLPQLLQTLRRPARIHDAGAGEIVNRGGTADEAGDGPVRVRGGRPAHESDVRAVAAVLIRAACFHRG